MLVCIIVGHQSAMNNRLHFFSKTMFASQSCLSFPTAVLRSILSHCTPNNYYSFTELTLFTIYYLYSYRGLNAQPSGHFLTTIPCKANAFVCGWHAPFLVEH